MKWRKRIQACTRAITKGTKFKECPHVVREIIDPCAHKYANIYI
jgi:hypothetical protein